jgi:cation/acetate symporter
MFLIFELATLGIAKSAAILLGLTSMVYFKGFDGFIYAVCSSSSR